MCKLIDFTLTFSIISLIHNNIENQALYTTFFIFLSTGRIIEQTSQNL